MKNRTLFAASALLTTTVGIAVADQPPGYVWGIANCGPNQTNSEAACLICCRDGLIAGDIDSEEHAGCTQLCEDATFHRDTFWGFFFGGYRPFNF